MTRTDALKVQFAEQLDRFRPVLDVPDARGSVDCEIRLRKAGEKTKRLHFSLLFEPGDVSEPGK